MAVEEKEAICGWGDLKFKFWVMLAYGRLWTSVTVIAPVHSIPDMDSTGLLLANTPRPRTTTLYPASAPRSSFDAFVMICHCDRRPALFFSRDLRLLF